MSRNALHPRRGNPCCRAIQSRPLTFPPALRFPPRTPSASIPPHGLAKCKEPFSRRLDSACVRSPRGFGGVSRLHIAFREWEVQRGGVPSTRDTFERLLAERGFLMGEVAGVVLVSSLIFREDFEVYQ